MESRQAGSTSSAERLVKAFMAYYRNFSSESIDQLGEIYTQDIEFIDPVHRIEGLLAVKKYLKKMMFNLDSYCIRYTDLMVGQYDAYVAWEMDYAHRKLNRGRIITVTGITRLKYSEKVYFHQDYYDLGALIYENLPMLGTVTRRIKKHLSE